ncbi:hypothetical protein CUJ83_12725 [Methanocella sp. CWC-04]|uniref:Protein-S-isoprenylcysteine O-methyltransferase Ste14 n=1 Tax=Methanooceanicella nereidis TaxID=2052831 RepID=A0AAP2W5S4_9EURY|nr:methyltransferase [Methanocella sp. CWC-04]MCD1295860.1 hypothetical protein [Methanocella sp. CWC-04]
MIEWINVIIMTATCLLSFYFYIKSVGPAALEKKIGKNAYKKCTQYRMLSGIFMTISFLCYVVYYFFPLPIPVPQTFPWDWRFSAVLAVILAIPSGYILLRGVLDAGEESMIVKKEHTMYGGIYDKIRHPQALGELPFVWVISLLLNSPFLFVFSFIWVPIYYYMCIAEEKDLEIRYGQKYLEYKKNTGFLIPKNTK